MIHYVVIYALIGSCYSRTRLGNHTRGGMMDLDPQRSTCMVQVVEETFEEVLGPTLGELVVLIPLKEMMWSWGLGTLGDGPKT